jgi:hypothetical protein
MFYSTGPSFDIIIRLFSRFLVCCCLYGLRDFSSEAFNENYGSTFWGLASWGGYTLKLYTAVIVAVS